MLLLTCLLFVQGLPMAFQPRPGLIRTAAELRVLNSKVSVDVFKGGGDR